MNTIKPELEIPHLTVASSFSPHEIEQHILDKEPLIESWFRRQWQHTKVPFYCSVDIRNAGFKLAPIDTNLFPAGFNNLNPLFQPLCIHAVQFALSIERTKMPIDRIIIVPENHTRNQFYLENLLILGKIIERAGFEVRFGSLESPLTEPVSITLASGKTLTIEPIERENDQIRIADFIPEMILLNNDLSSGRPEILTGITQIVTPDLNLGWTQRLKSIHFKHYQQLAENFAKLLDIDPWLIQPFFRNCGEIDFMKRKGEDCLSKNVEVLLKTIQKKYDAYQVKQEPFVIMKADAGTYGMGVMTLRSVEDVKSLNRKQRTKMATTKEGLKVDQVILQEGIYTNETWQNSSAVAEPVVYMIAQQVVGGFYRVHTDRGLDENLNAPGMRFEWLAFDDCCMNLSRDTHQNRFYVYSVIARLALLAAANE